jgi:hypothetical protein
MRIRHFGLLANRHRAIKLARCRALLEPTRSKRDLSNATADLSLEPTSSTITEPQICPVCGGGPLRIVELLAPLRGIPP